MAQRFGEKLRYARTHRGMTQVELAKLLELASHSHIANLEAARDVPSLTLVVRLGRALNVSLDYLLRDTIPVEALVDAPAPYEQAEATSQPLGVKLRLLRQARNWSQTDVARRLQLTQRGRVSNLENGYKLPSLDLALALADVFAITVDELMQGVLWQES